MGFTLLAHAPLRMATGALASSLSQTSSLGTGAAPCLVMIWLSTDFVGEPYVERRILDPDSVGRHLPSAYMCNFSGIACSMGILLPSGAARSTVEIGAAT